MNNQCKDRVFLQSCQEQNDAKIEQNDGNRETQRNKKKGRTTHPALCVNYRYERLFMLFSDTTFPCYRTLPTY